MLKIFKTKNDKLEEITLDTLEENSWINLTQPTMDEIALVANKLNIDTEYLKDALDVEERSRIEFNNNIMLIITNVPIMENEDNFDTIPLGIILTSEQIITVSIYENKILSYFLSDTQKLFSTEKKTDFLFQILFQTTQFYLRYLEFMNKRTDKIELDLRKTMQNKVLFRLFEVQKSLVYFTTALNNNGIILEKIMKLKDNSIIQHLMNIKDEDIGILEDITIENKQALEMVEMYRNVLENMMEVFASIISNNLNTVMKFLTSVTILLAVPTMVSSFWGMNVPVPLALHPYGFSIIIILALLFAAFIGYKLWQKDMF